MGATGYLKREGAIGIRWIEKDFMRMSPEFRGIAKEEIPATRNRMDRCWNCGYEFRDGDMIALAGVEGDPNHILCQRCVGRIVWRKEK